MVNWHRLGLLVCDFVNHKSYYIVIVNVCLTVYC